MKLLAELDGSDECEEDFCARMGIRPSTLHAWRTRAAAPGSAPRRRAQRPSQKGRERVLYSPEQRREAVEAFQKSGRTREDFARLWGCSSSSLSTRLRAHCAGGPQALETQPRKRKTPRAPHTAVRRALERVGWTAGEGPVDRVLGQAVPLRLVRRLVRELKAERRACERHAVLARRVSTRVGWRDAVWCLDATHVGRDAADEPLQVEVPRDAASGLTLGISVGPPSTGRDVLGVLRRARAERGGLPLVLITDNGAAYRSVHVTKRIADRGIGELKHEAEVGLRGPGRRKGEVAEAGEIERKLAAARVRLDQHRPRRSRGWLTSAEADRALPSWRACTSRRKLQRRVACAIEEALQGSPHGRARQAAVRNAILGVLEHEGLISRTTGRGTQCRGRVAGVS